jgi:hypothetical protein
VGRRPAERKSVRSTRFRPAHPMAIPFRGRAPLRISGKESEYEIMDAAFLLTMHTATESTRVE